LELGDNFGDFLELGVTAADKCSEFIRSPPVENTVRATEIFLKVIAIVAIVLACTYPIAVTVISYSWNSISNRNCLKNCVQRLLISTNDEDLPFCSYILHPPTLVTLGLALAIGLAVAALFICQAYVRTDMKTLITVELYAELSAAEMNFTSSVNDKIQIVVDEIHAFLDEVAGAGLVFSDKIEEGYDQLDVYYGYVEDNVPVIGTYVIDVLECMIPFLRFDDYLEKFNEIRVEVVEQLKNVTDFSFNETSTTYSDELVIQLEELREDLDYVLTGVIISLLVRGAPILVAFPCLVIQGIIFLTLDCIHGTEEYD